MSVRRAGAGAGAVAALLAAALTSLAHAGTPRDEERIEGVVTRVTDGDTLWVRPRAVDRQSARRPVKVRLVGLDAPERCQAHGREAGAALAARVLDRHVVVRRRAVDDYGRALGTLWLAGDDVGAWLVEGGHAWSARYRGDPGPYAAEEQRARTAHRGLFADADPELPRDFRRRHGPCEDRR